MATLTIDINNRSIVRKKKTHFLESLNFVSTISKDTKCGLDKALEDVAKGRVFTAENVKDLMEKTT
jgi:hypothetical protein